MLYIQYFAHLASGSTLYGSFNLYSRYQEVYFAQLMVGSTSNGSTSSCSIHYIIVHPQYCRQYLYIQYLAHLMAHSIVLQITPR